MSNISGSNISIGGSASGFFSVLDQARAKVKSFAMEANSSLVGGFRAADSQLRTFRSGLNRLGDDLINLSRKAAIVGTLPALLAAGQSYRDYAQMQMLQRGVERYGETLKDVRELAKLPNIGVFDGAKSLISLKAMRMESDLAKRSIKAFANAITDAGGSASDLDPALVNLRQFMATKHINQVDLRQLANRIPQTMEALRNAFGTTDTEELNKLGIDKFIEGFVSELEKIPPVAGGAQMSMDQFFDSLKFGTATLGEGVDAALGITSAFGKAGNAIDSLVIRYRELSPEVQKSVIQLGGFVALIPVLTAGIGALVKYMPMLTGALGLSWPVVAIAGTAAALAGLLGVMQVVNDESGRLAVKIEDLNTEISKTEEVSKKIVPLIDRYEELKIKAAEGADVQEELKKVIQEIAALSPSAATGFDKFGNALDINTEKARANNKEQLKLLETLKNMSVEALRAQKALKQAEVDKLISEVNSGESTRFVGDDSGGAVFTRSLSESEIKKRIARVKELNSSISEIDKSLGQKSAALFQQMGGEDRLEKETNLLLERKKAFQETEEAYKRANRAASDNRYSSRAAKELEAASSARSKAFKELQAQQKLVDRLNSSKRDLGLQSTATAKDTPEEAAFSLTTASVVELEKHLDELEGQYKKLDRTTEGWQQKQKELASEINSTRVQIDRLMAPISKSGGKASIDERIANLTEQNDYKRLLKDRELILKLHLERLREQYQSLNPSDFSFAEEQEELGKRIASIDRIITNEKAKKVLEMRRELDLQKQLNKEFKIAEGSAIASMNLSHVYRQEVGQSRTLAGNRMQMALFGRVDSFMRDQSTRPIQGPISTFEDLSLFGKINKFGVDTNVFSGLEEDAKKFLDNLDDKKLDKFFGSLSTRAKLSSDGFSKAINQKVKNIKDLELALENILRSGVMEGFVTLGEGLANHISQVGQKAGHGFKMMMGGLLQEVGKAMILYSGIMQKIEITLASGGLGVWGGVALGTTAVFAGQMLKNSVTKSQQKAASGMSGNVRRFATGSLVHRQMMAVVGDNQNSAYDPEVISPLSRLEKNIQNAVKGVMGTGNRLQVEVVGTIDNDVIRLANVRAGERFNRLRG